MKLHRALLGLCLSAAMLAPGCGRQIMPEVSSDPSHEAAARKGRKREIPPEKLETKGEMREWQSGETTFKAALIEVKDGNVKLLGANEDVLTIPVSKLSAADQQYVRQHGGGG